MKIKPRTIAYIAIIGTLIIATLVLFLIAKDLKTEASSYDVAIIKATNELAKLTEGTEAYAAKLAELNNYNALKDGAATSYKLFALLAYGTSMIFLISIGFIVQHSSKVKEKEDQAVALS